jgi:ankyrin repeat protein
MRTLCILIANDVEINALGYNSKWKPALSEAIENDMDGLAQVLVDAGADPNIQVGMYESTPLETALQKGSDMRLVQNLLKVGAKFHVLCKSKVLSTILQRASSSCDFDLVRILVDSCMK